MPTKAELEYELPILRAELASIRGDKDVPDTHDTTTIQGTKNLNAVWGLTEVAQLYRTPVRDLVSEREAAAHLQARKRLPDAWGEELR
jgi:hypothetical protein